MLRCMLIVVSLHTFGAMTVLVALLAPTGALIVKVAFYTPLLCSTTAEIVAQMGI